MIQKTLRITNYTLEKVAAVVSAVAAMPEYSSATQVLLIIMEQNWDTDLIRERNALICATLPKAEIVGTTHVDSQILGEKDKNCILSFLFFEHPAFTLGKIDMAGKDDAGVRSILAEHLRPVEDRKGLLVLFQKLGTTTRDVQFILEGAGDMPIFGADAAVSNYVNDGGRGYVFDRDGIYRDTLIYVVFHGKDLHVRVSYNFGWTPVGKTMTVTDILDDYTITEIDHRPAAEIYEKYLGIPYKTNSLSIMNICEFPLTVEQHGQLMAKIPYAWTEDGHLQFMTTIHKGAHIRLSYGLPQQIFTQVCADTAEFQAFEPQGMLMVVCLNRLIFLREGEQREVEAYRAVAPDVAYLHGNSEIYMNNGIGGEMHSALVAVGFREGEAYGHHNGAAHCPTPPGGDHVIPLELRLMTFLRAVTSDLEETTRELIQLKDHLEDEVEIKTRENESLSLHVVKTLADAIDAKDTYTNGHSGRVAAYSREIARRAGYSEKGQNEIYMMGLLHDVGKIGVPDAVINKPGKLTDEEFAEIKKHPGMGARILKNIEEMPKLATGAHWHHERYDGRGYPDGLESVAIPEEARIIAVADAYDAMTSNRSYRRGMDQDVVREQIENGKGTQFDPRFADIMIAMIDEDTEYRMREL